MSICNPYYDQYGRKTDLMHVAKGATYPINILGNAASADVANSPVTDLDEDSADTISFRVGDEKEDASNEYTHKITKVDEAIKSQYDSEGNDIAETYAKKTEVVALDPETGKVPTEYLPDTTNNVNFVNGKTGDVTLYGTDIAISESDENTITEALTSASETLQNEIDNLTETKANSTDIPRIGEELYGSTDSESHTTFNAYSYTAEQVGNEFRLYKNNTTEGTQETVSSFGIRSTANLSFAPVGNVITIGTGTISINFDNQPNYNVCLYDGFNQAIGAWTITNDGNTRVMVLRYGGRSSDGSKTNIIPIGTEIRKNGSFTFVLDSDDPYTDKSSFALMIYKEA